MIIVYTSKTGFTKRYADLLAEKTGLLAYPAKKVPRELEEEDILYLGWMKVGKVQGLNRINREKIRAVCGSGTGQTAEPDPETVIARNGLEKTPFFYLRGGCFPLKKQKGLDKLMLTAFVRMLKSREPQDSKTDEAIRIIVEGFDGVKAENLEPVLQWLKEEGEWKQ